MIRVQAEDFDVAQETEALTGGRTDIGAVVTFVGRVRGAEAEGAQSVMTLEHYPGMTEKMLQEIEAQAHERWALDACLVVHRHGALKPGDNIVLVITASAHRRDAYEASEFLMDCLKTKAPFWKHEDGPDGGDWVAAKGSDDDAAQRWKKAPGRQKAPGQQKD